MSNLLIISATNDNNLDLSEKLQSSLVELGVESNIVSLENFDFPLFGGKADVDDSIIRNFVDNFLLAQDSRALRTHIKNSQPDVDLTFFPRGSDDTVEIPIGLKFFWPDVD